MGEPIPGRIDPRIFSNFLEHLGGAIYDGVWANVVQNPQFAGDARGRLYRWSRESGAHWLDEGPAGHSMRLPEGSATTQLITPPVHRCLSYRVSLLARADSDPAEIEISLRRADKPSVVVAQRIHANAKSWARSRFEIQLPAGAVERGEAFLLHIATLKSAAAVASVELFPADAIDDMDPDVVQASRDLRIELLRWPGGNFASGYHWRNGIGPRDRRPTVPNPAWPGLETHHFGTDEFMRFCRHIGAKPMICVNAGDGTPEEAAAWVQYCNGATNTPMGALRAKNGHPKPYNVRVWEIGNELYGNWQIGHTDSAANAKRFVEFRKAMLAADPTIEIVATGKGDEFTATGLCACDRWNHELMEAARSDGRPPDHISIHPLVPLPSNLSGRSYDEVYSATMAHPHWLAQSRIPELAKSIGPSKLAITEWGIIHGGPDWLKYPNHDAQSGAVYAALFFHAMMRNANSIGISNTTALMHGGGIRRQNGVTILLPMYHIMKMYGRAHPRQLLATQVSESAYISPETGFLPAVANVPYLDPIGVHGDGARYLFVVNRDQHRSRRATIKLPGNAINVTVEMQSADPQTRNTFDHPNAVMPQTQSIQIHHGELSHEFPPCSVCCIQWES